MRMGLKLQCRTIATFSNFVCFSVGLISVIVSFVTVMHSACETPPMWDLEL